MSNKKQLEKMLRLADIKKPINEGVKSSAIEFIKSSSDGSTYAIVRENRTYYIKSTKTKHTLLESDFNYLGGLQNRTKNSFRGYDDAVTRLNLMFNDHNRVNGINESTDMVNFSHTLNEKGEYVDGTMSEDIEPLEEKRFILKQPKPKKKKEPETDTGGEVGGDDFDFGGEDESGDTKDTEGGDDFDFGGEEGGDDFDFGGEEGESEDTEGGDDFDFGGEEGEDTEGGDDFDFGGEDEGESDMEFDSAESEGGDSIKDIQRTTGKLGQQLRDTEDISSDMQKWVAKSVVSALNLNTMDDADKEDIINALESGGEEKETEQEIDFMDDDMEYSDVEYADGRKFDDDRAGERDLEYGEEILLDDSDEDEGPGGYLGWENLSQEDIDDSEELEMRDIDMGIRDKGYLNIDPEVASGNIDYMGDDIEDVALQSDEISYMTDDDMVPCEDEGCGESLVTVSKMDKPIGKMFSMTKEMEEGMSNWNDAGEDGGTIGWETNEEVSYMGDEYTEEEIDSLFDNSGNSDDLYGMNNPQEAPTEPTTKPDTDTPTPSRPNKNPFTPPGRIKPGEETRPKAEVDYMAAQPSPSQEPNEAPTTAPPDTDKPARPNKNPFTPPGRIKPGEETRPKAGKYGDYDDDVEFS